jgi:fatty-acyl-CoA synthase
MFVDNVNPTAIETGLRLWEDGTSVHPIEVERHIQSISACLKKYQVDDFVLIQIEGFVAFISAVLVLEQSGIGYGLLDPTFTENEKASAIKICPAPILKFESKGYSVDESKSDSGWIRNNRARLMSSNVYFTSGTTGTVKAVIRSKKKCKIESSAIKEMYDLHAGESIALKTPFWHAYGFGMAVMPALQFGLALHYSKINSPRTVYEEVVTYHPKLFLAVPSQYEIYGLKSFNMENNQTQFIASGGPLSSRVVERFRKNWGRTIRNQYGSTETGPISITGLDDGDKGTIGTTYGGVSIELESYLSSNQTLTVRSPWLFDGYLPSSPEYVICEEPVLLYEMPDLGKSDRQGNIILVGRKDTIVNLHGKKVSIQKIVDVVSEFQGVQDARVCLQNEEGSDFLVAYVVSEIEIKQSSIFEHCQERLAPYEIPSDIVFLDEFPKNKMGKVTVTNLRTVKGRL